MQFAFNLLYQHTSSVMTCHKGALSNAPFSLDCRVFLERVIITRSRCGTPLRERNLTQVESAL